ncbi:MAG TPA: ABC transporter permease [Vitreimonas sp.]|jgi:lipopolysaccharide transport system permease protein|nr:ABC transporter permease [Vitreimonas sp.]HVM12353.1 ABC transporter permease [Actinomycetota bacterium]
MTSTPSEAFASPRVSAPRRGPVAQAMQGLREIIERRRLIRYLVGADLKRTHADTIFGQVWWILDPLLQMAIYVVLVTVIFNRPIPDYPLFLFAGILPWKWFATTLSDSAISITGRQSLIRQVQFPKVVLPTASVTAGSVSFVIGLVALAFVYLFFLHRLTPWVLLIPVIAVVQYVFTLALAIALSALNAFFRDVQNVLRHTLRLWFYMSAILYPLDRVPEGLRPILLLNPFTHLVDAYRSVTWGTTAPDWLSLLVVLVLSLVLVVLALGLFKRLEPAFARIL